MELYIIGSGGNCKIIIDLCELLNYKIKGIFDDKYNGTEITIYKNNKIIDNIDGIKNYSKINIVNSIGDNNARFNIYKKLENLELNWINLIHPHTYISNSAILGVGNIIFYGAFINSDAKIGNHNLINTYSVIEHDCIIGDFNHFAPKSTICGGVKFGNLNLMGVGASAIPLKTVGNNNKVGGMTVLINNFESDNTIVGIPGKIIKKNV